MTWLFESATPLRRNKASNIATPEINQKRKDVVKASDVKT